MEVTRRGLLKKRRVTSRIDICSLNGTALQPFWDFEQWNLEGCTIPTHKLQCVTFRLGGGSQFAKKPFRPHTVPDYTNLPDVDVEHLTANTIEQHIDKLSISFENEDIEAYWVEWCRLAEKLGSLTLRDC